MCKKLFVIYTFTCIGYYLLISLCWKISAPTSTAQNITIQVTSKYDLAINCSIINSNQLDVLQLIQLQRYNSTNGTFDKVISMSIYEKNSKILWLDKALENRSSANGTLKEAELRLFIGKESVQCSTDFTKYKCSMEGILKSGSSVTNEVTASPNDTCTCMYVYIKYNKSHSIEAVCEFNEWYSKERNVCAFYQAI